MIMLDMNSKTDGIADFLTCLGSLERKNSQLFETLSNKIVYSLVKPQLTKIADDNMKHATILEEIGQQIGNPKIKTKDCKKKLSVVCRTTEVLLEQVKQKEKITLEELTDYLEQLESSGGAAQYLLIQAETFLFMSKEISRLYEMDFLEFNNLLNDIAKDVEEHIQLLEDIKEIIANEQEEDDQVMHPMFKYQRPDAWVTPVSGAE
jgi:rubrerythrin